MCVSTIVLVSHTPLLGAIVVRSEAPSCPRNGLYRRHLALFFAGSAPVDPPAQRDDANDDGHGHGEAYGEDGGHDDGLSVGVRAARQRDRSDGGGTASFAEGGEASGNGVHGACGGDAEGLRPVL